ncbi:MAG: hypothetical protein Ct9H90mP5_10650 [Acidimicrobiaceae bacterium]|nr:MAG: hypothetical protein Ct9H90mP5_10650 [Acidimicrobiaceae bacterium]
MNSLPTRHPPPKALLEESYEFLGDNDLPYKKLHKSRNRRSEYEKLWSKVWQWACPVDHIPEPGDYFVYDFGHLSSLIVRTTEEVQSVLQKHVCTVEKQLKQPGTCGFSKETSCPFHGWTWSLGGKPPLTFREPGTSPTSHKNLTNYQK